MHQIQSEAKMRETRAYAGWPQLQQTAQENNGEKCTKTSPATPKETETRKLYRRETERNAPRPAQLSRKETETHKLHRKTMERDAPRPKFNRDLNILINRTTQKISNVIGDLQPYQSTWPDWHLQKKNLSNDRIYSNLIFSLDLTYQSLILESLLSPR